MRSFLGRPNDRWSKVDHSDAVARLRGTATPDEISVTLLADRCLRVDISARTVAPGSLDGVAAALFETLRKAGPMDIADLAAAMGVSGEASVRMVGEMAAAFEKTRWVSAESVNGRLRVESADRCPWGFVSTTSISAVHYVPPSRRIERLDFGKVRREAEASSDLDNIPLQTFEWPEDVFNLDIQSDVRDAFERRYRQRRLGPAFWNDGRPEVLRRSRLVSEEPRLWGTDVLSVNRTYKFVLSRCYLYPARSRSGRQTLGVMVRTYPVGGEQYAYSQYLQEEPQTELLEELRHNSVRVGQLA
jgi:hypothetical protein